MKEFIKFCGTNAFRTNTNAKGDYTIQQTERNKLKAQAIDKFYELLKGVCPEDCNVDLTKEGIVVSVYNEKIDNEICFILNPTIPALTYDAQFEAEEYARECKVKAEEKAKKEQAKIAKAKRDAELRKKYAEEKAKKRGEG